MHKGKQNLMFPYPITEPCLLLKNSTKLPVPDQPTIMRKYNYLGTLVINGNGYWGQG